MALGNSRRLRVACLLAALFHGAHVVADDDLIDDTDDGGATEAPTAEPTSDPTSEDGTTQPTIGCTTTTSYECGKGETCYEESPTPCIPPSPEPTIEPTVVGHTPSPTVSPKPTFKPTSVCTDTCTEGTYSFLAYYTCEKYPECSGFTSSNTGCDCPGCVCDYVYADDGEMATPTPTEACKICDQGNGFGGWYSCDGLIELGGSSAYSTCESIEAAYGCDCSGCECGLGPTPEPTMPRPTLSPKPTTTPVDCPATCTVTASFGDFGSGQTLISDVTCDEAIQNEQLREQLGENYDVECSTLEADHGCDCGGCSCAPLPTTPPTNKPTPLPSPEPTLAPNPIPTVTPGNPTRSPTQRPTPSPSGTPTPKPTTLAPTPARYTTVTWSDALTLSGVMASEIDSEGENAIKGSIAEASEYVSATGITITAITDVARRLEAGTATTTTARARARQGVVGLGRNGRGRELATSGVTVDYDTVVILESTGFDDSAALFDNVAAAVETHVTSGDFETALQTHESMASVEVDEDAYVKPTGFVAAFPPSSTPSFEPTSAPSPEPVPESESEADAAGGPPILIIGVGGVAILGLAFAGFMSRGKSKGKVAAAPSPVVEMAPTAPAPAPSAAPPAPGGQPIPADSVPLEVAVAVATPVETPCGAQHSGHSARDANDPALLTSKGGFNPRRPSQQAPLMFDPHTGQRIRNPGDPP